MGEEEAHPDDHADGGEPGQHARHFEAPSVSDRRTAWCRADDTETEPTTSDRARRYRAVPGTPRDRRSPSWCWWRYYSLGALEDGEPHLDPETSIDGRDVDA
ncbi:hypothetical protein GCM10009872_17630 [Actinopolymorpha rutila]